MDRPRFTKCYCVAQFLVSVLGCAVRAHVCTVHAYVLGCAVHAYVCVVQTTRPTGARGAIPRRHCENVRERRLALVAPACQRNARALLQGDVQHSKVSMRFVLCPFKRVLAVLAYVKSQKTKEATSHSMRNAEKTVKVSIVERMHKTVSERFWKNFQICINICEVLRSTNSSCEALQCSSQTCHNPVLVHNYQDKILCQTKSFHLNSRYRSWPGSSKQFRRDTL